MNRRDFFVGFTAAISSVGSAAGISVLTKPNYAEEFVTFYNMYGDPVTCSKSLVESIWKTYRIDPKKFISIAWGTNFDVEAIEHGKEYRIKTNDPRDYITVFIEPSPYGKGSVSKYINIWS